MAGRARNLFGPLGRLLRRLRPKRRTPGSRSSGDPLRANLRPEVLSVCFKSTWTARHGTQPVVKPHAFSIGEMYSSQKPQRACTPWLPQASAACPLAVTHRYALSEACLQAAPFAASASQAGPHSLTSLGPPVQFSPTPSSQTVTHGPPPAEGDALPELHAIAIQNVATNLHCTTHDSTIAPNTRPDVHRGAGAS